MLAKAIGNYGGPYVDATAADNPETDLLADEGNRVFEDVAQATHTVERARMSFLTVAAAAPQTIPAATVTNVSNWGSGAGQKPVVTKGATGRYTITYATSFTDALGVSESVSFILPTVQAMFADNIADDLYAEVFTLASNVITVKTESPKGTLADVGNVGGNPFTVSLGLR